MRVSRRSLSDHCSRVGPTVLTHLRTLGSVQDGVRVRVRVQVSVVVCVCIGPPGEFTTPKTEGTTAGVHTSGP